MKTVLLHGLGQTAQGWKEVVRQLATLQIVRCVKLMWLITLQHFCLIKQFL